MKNKNSSKQEDSKTTEITIFLQRKDLHLNLVKNKSVLKSKKYQ